MWRLYLQTYWKQGDYDTDVVQLKWAKKNALNCFKWTRVRSKGLKILTKVCVGEIKGVWKVEVGCKGLKYVSWELE